MDLTQFTLSNKFMKANIKMYHGYENHSCAYRLGRYTDCEEDVAEITVNFTKNKNTLSILVPSNFDKITKEMFIENIPDCIDTVSEIELYNLFVACVTLINAQLMEPSKDDIEIVEVIWVTSTKTGAEKKRLEDYCRNQGINIEEDDDYAALFKCSSGYVALFTFSDDKTIDELREELGEELGCSDKVFEEFRDKLKRLFERKEMKAKTVNELKKAVDGSKKILNTVEDKATDKAADLLTFIKNIK